MVAVTGVSIQLSNKVICLAILIDFCRLREEAGYNNCMLYAAHCSLTLQRRSFMPWYLAMLTITTVYSTARVQLICVRSSHCWMEQRNSSSENESTSTSQTPCITTSTGCRYNNISSSLKAVYASEEVLLLCGTVVLGRRAHSRVVYSQLSSPLSCSSQSDYSARSFGVIQITQLPHFRLFDLELAVTSYPWLDPDIHWFL